MKELENAVKGSFEVGFGPELPLHEGTDWLKSSS